MSMMKCGIVKMSGMRVIRKLCSFLIASVMICSLIFDNVELNQINSITTDAINYVYGDVNQDGKLNIFDDIKLTNCVLKGDELLSNNANVSAADLDGDGIVNYIDVLLMKYFITNSIDFFPIEAKVDTDGDNLSDYIEKNITKTNVNLKDSDGDNLSDWEETVKTFTDPLIRDTDLNGIEDQNEDFDKDGLINIDEIKYSTNPYFEDTDEDSLNDFDEINKYKTNPNNKDTDQDNLFDDEEVLLGLNPLKLKTDNVTVDNQYAIQQKLGVEEIEFNENSSAYDISIDIKASGALKHRLKISESKYSNTIQNESVLGEIIDFEYDDLYRIESVKLTFKLTENIESYKLQDLMIFEYIKEANILIPVKTNYDSVTNSIYIDINKQGTYCVVDKIKWANMYNLMENYTPVKNVNATGDIEVVFLVDGSSLLNGDNLSGVQNTINTVGAGLFESCENVKISVYSYYFDLWGSEADLRYLTIDKDTTKSYASTKEELIKMVSNLKALSNDSSNFFSSAFVAVISDGISFSSTNKYIFTFVDSIDDMKAMNNSIVPTPSLSNLKYSLSNLENENINTSIILSEEASKYSKSVNNLIEPIENTGGIILIKDDSYAGDVYSHITGSPLIQIENLWENIALLNGSTSSLNPMTQTDYQASKGDFIDGYNYIDSDEDGLYDYEEVFFIDELIKFNENGTMILPTFEELCKYYDITQEGYEQLLASFDQYNNMLDKIKNLYCLPFYCSPLLSDTDHDGLDDLDEMELGTNLSSVDTDGDLLNDFMEFDIGYDPLSKNFDGDSYTDFEELEKDLDPFIYDETFKEHRENFILGALIGDYNDLYIKKGIIKQENSDSFGYICGHIFSGFLVYGDLRDLTGSLMKKEGVDWWTFSFTAAAVVPVAGDATKVINKMSTILENQGNVVKASKYMQKALSKVGTSEELYNKELVEKLLKMVVEKSSKNADAMKILKENNITDDVIVNLLKRGNKLDDIIEILGKRLKMSDEVIEATSTRGTDIKNAVTKYWGSDLKPKVYAEAVATETAIMKYQDEGYDLVYAQRNLLNNGRNGPDIIMKHKTTGEYLIVEAKGSQTTQRICLMSDGKKEGTRLTSVINKEKVSYLSLEWLSNRKEQRFLNAFEEFIDGTTPKSIIDDCDYNEAKKAIVAILDDGNNAKYKLSVLFTGVNGANVQWGNNVSDFVKELLENTKVSELDMFTVNFK